MAKVPYAYQGQVKTNLRPLPNLTPL